MRRQNNKFHRDFPHLSKREMNDIKKPPPQKDVTREKGSKKRDLDG